MRWITSLFFVLALGILCVVGCTDEDGVPEYPRCLSDEQCDDGDPCSIDHCNIYGGDGYCEHWDKPCEGNWHEDCSDLEAYYCDPETGVVECTGHTDWFHGQTCCIESEYACPDGIWSCRDYCVRRGYCIDGGCVDGNGYPRDCTDRDAATPCEVGDTIGLCWKGDCAVLDCTGLSSGTLCWFTGYDGAGECRSGVVGDWRCFVAEPSGGGPPGWTCGAEYYGTGDGCDCGCGVIDPDCADGTVASCDYCGQPGSCSAFLCPLGIDPVQNWLCSY